MPFRTISGYPLNIFIFREYIFLYSLLKYFLNNYSVQLRNYNKGRLIKRILTDMIIQNITRLFRSYFLFLLYLKIILEIFFTKIRMYIFNTSIFRIFSKYYVQYLIQNNRIFERYGISEFSKYSQKKKTS